MESALYLGKVYHERFTPTQHAFSYNVAQVWLQLDEVNKLHHSVTGFSNTGFAPWQFKRSDFLGDNAVPLKAAVLSRMTELAGKKLSGDVFLLSQLRNFGLCFNPVNLYFLREPKSNLFIYMLAEVSNTPWNERHHYLVDLAKQEDTQKVFHVSPFNPLDMTYKWKIAQPSQRFALALECHKGSRHFIASMQMNKKPLNSKTFRNVMTSIPNMTLRTVIGIYWQALRLFVKRTPIYSHPINSQESNHVAR